MRAILSTIPPLLLCHAGAAVAADDVLAPVVVTGTREPEPLDRSTADIVVIDADRIRTSSADSVEDLLRREAGMQVVRNGGPGQNAGFFIRGAATNATVVLVDGVRVGSATLGQAELEALSPAQIERIEVLRGPASSLYGADAVGGVVRIVTRRGEGPPRFGANAEFGGYRSRRFGASTSGAIERVDYALALGRETSRGVSAIRPGDAFGAFNPDRDGFARNFASASVGVTPASGHRIGVVATATRLDAQYDGSEFLPPSFAPDASPDFRNLLQTRVFGADYRGTVTQMWTTTLQAARATDDLTSGGTVRDRFRTRRDQLTWQNALKLGAEQQLVVAYERLNERASAPAFADPLRRHNDAGVVGYSGRFGTHTLQADARYDDNSAYGDNTTGRVGYALEVAPGWKLRGLAGTTFRAPTFNDLFFPGFGVATVRPERGKSVEVGASWQGSGASAALTLWRNKVTNLIGFQPDLAFCPADPAYVFGCAANTGRARLQGATLTGTLRRGGLDVRAAVDLLDAHDVETGMRLARRAAHQESVAADWTTGAWRVGASFVFVGSRPDAGVVLGGSRPDADVVLGGYGVVDLRASWRFAPSWRLDAKLSNALDHRIEPVRDYRGLGRQAWLGVRFETAGV